MEIKQREKLDKIINLISIRNKQLERLDELVKSIPDRTALNPTESIPDEKPESEGYKTNSFIYYFFCVFGIVFLSIFYLFQV